MSKTFETVSFHIVKPCDKKCKFCYATFDDMAVKQMSLADAKEIVFKLQQAGVQKITFAGGEPMLYKYIKEIIIYAKSLGLTTSIITNGGRLTFDWLLEMRAYLDWVGLSIDSFHTIVNIKSGRFISNKDAINYKDILDMLYSLNYKIKINTVVHKFNNLDSSIIFKIIDIIRNNSDFKIDRWKIFQTLKVEGQNDLQFENIMATKDKFDRYIRMVKNIAIKNNLDTNFIVPEDNEAMTGSYLLVDPQGRLFENSKGTHTYSDKLTQFSFEHCIKQITLDRDMFIQRGGIYNWK